MTKQSAHSPAQPLHGTQEHGSAGGWGALNAVTQHLSRQKVLMRGNKALLTMNKPGGFDCPSCAWPDPKTPHTFEYCENGAKAVAWEATRKRTTPEFFAAHTLTELRTWTDHDLEDQGRLTHPMRYDAASDTYRPVSWADAFAEIGAELRALDDPWKLELYTSGRSSNEAAFLYQLFGRLYGMNNFPDCSNMCHETTTTAMPESIGVGKGTLDLEDFAQADAIFIIGQNPGTNSPRMMSELHDAVHRGVPILTFNPLREKALVRFASPQAVRDMALPGGGVAISSQYHQVRIGGDMAAMQGLCKVVIEADDEARRSGAPRILDVAFIEQHCVGLEAFAEHCRGLSWERLERYSGLTQAAMTEAAEVYMKADRVIACWGMGVTQHRRGGDVLQQIINLLLLRGNVGKPGAGPCPIRGHSNVQGDRTVGIYQKPKEPFLARLDQAFAFRAPREGGHDVVECCEALLRDEPQAFIGLGGNFFRAIPDIERVAPHVANLRLTVQIATKLNWSHTLHGRSTFLLPCLGRTERDVQASGVQTITVEDSMSMVHGSTGSLEPASPELLSEIAIVAGIAKATLGERHPHIDWDALVGDYALIRDKIEAVLPEQFADYNARIEQPGGFRLPNGARERQWDTPNGKANFLFPGDVLDEDDSPPDAEHLQLMTIRSHDQFNTTIYSNRDRYRDIDERMVAMLSPEDMRRHEVQEGDFIDFIGAALDGISRRAGPFKVIAYDVPAGCCAAYYPETNSLAPLANHDTRSHTPASKSLPVRIERLSQEQAMQRRGLIAAG
ncbi:FdhF/YdeP family oxidoreductase [Pseudomonas sp. Marseille-Q7302]